MSIEPEFPLPIRMRGRLFWRRSELELYKRKLLAFASGAPAPSDLPADQIETFVSAEQVTREFAFGRRTLGRRIAGRCFAGVAAE